MAKVALTNSQVGYGGPHDHLPLDCNGKTIGNTSMDELRRILHGFQIPQAHTAPRDVICSRYANLLKHIGGEASDKAIMSFLEKTKDQ